jgi:hypothetical protein
MEPDFLKIDYDEWRDVAREYPREMGIFMAMLAEVEEDICQEDAA